MKSPAFALPSGLPRLSLRRPSNRTVILIGLAAYAVISWMILNSADNPPIRFRLDAARLTDCGLVVGRHLDIGHMGIGGIADAGSSQIAQIAYVLLELLRAAGQPQNHGRIAVQIEDSDIEQLDAVVGQPLAGAGQVVVMGVFDGGPDGRRVDSELLKMGQVFIAGVGGQAVGYFDFGHGLWA